MINHRIMGFGFLLYLQWEAMLISYLAKRVINIPFNDISTLVTKSDFKIAVRPGTSFEDAFKTASDPFWQKAWIDRIEPFLQDYKFYYGTSYTYHNFKSEFRMIITCSQSFFYRPKKAK